MASIAEERRKREYVERDLKESEERTVQESERVDKAGCHLALTPFGVHRVPSAPSPSCTASPGHCSLKLYRSTSPHATCTNSSGHSSLILHRMYVSPQASTH